MADIAHFSGSGLREDPSEKFLAHYGVKGMKWGIRKRSKKEERARAQRFKASQKRRTIPDDELNNRIARLEKEKKLKDLTNADLRPGRTVAKRIMSESGQKVAKVALTGTLLYAGKLYLENNHNIKDTKNSFDFKELSTYIPKPKSKG